MSTRLHPFARLSFAAIGMVFLQLLAGLGLAAIFVGLRLAQSPEQAVGKIVGEVARASESNVLLLSLFLYPIGLLWLGFCRAKLDKRSFVSLGLRRPRLGSNLMRGMLAGILAIGLIWAILYLTGTISVNGLSAASRRPDVVLAILGWLIAFGAVGFFEELVFRGYALHNLTNWLGWKVAVILQAAVFAVVHMGNVFAASDEARLAALGAMPAIFLIGVFFALSYRKTGSLWFPIGFHVAWNFSLGCIFSLPVSGIETFQLLDVQSNTQSWLSGGSFGAEGSFFLLPVLVALVWLMSQAPDHPQALLDLEIERPQPTEPSPDAVEIALPAQERMEIEEEARENRYRTKFGTSEGFDSDMLRELRELQHQREATEAQAREERAAQEESVENQPLQPPIVIEPPEPQAPEPQAPESQAEEVIAVRDAPEAMAQVDEAAPVVIEKETEKVTETAVPVENSIVEDEAPVIKTEPAAVKKARPKW